MNAHPLDLDQARAKAAALAVGTGCTKEFADAAKKAIARLRSAGLLVALIYGVKKEKEHARIVDSLAGYLRKGITPQALATTLTQVDSLTLRHETARAEAYLVWLARFADAAKTESAKDHP